MLWSCMYGLNVMESYVWSKCYGVYGLNVMSYVWSKCYVVVCMV